MYSELPFEYCSLDCISVARARVANQSTHLSLPRPRYRSRSSHAYRQ
jgi:hypothetical protein